MDDVADIFDRELEDFTRSSESGLDPGSLNPAAAIATKRLQVELHGDELVDQEAKAGMSVRVARLFCLFWHYSHLMRGAGR